MKSILRGGDLAIFDTTFGAAIVTAPAGVLTGSSPAKIRGASACVLGDEASVVVTASYSIPSLSLTAGTGLLTITSVGSDQRSQSSKSRSIPFLTEGTRFQAKLQVRTNATNLGGGSDSPTTMYMGGGTFSTSNTTTTA